MFEQFYGDYLQRSVGNVRVYVIYCAAGHYLSAYSIPALNRLLPAHTRGCHR